MGEGRLRERKNESNGSYMLEIFATLFALKAFKVGLTSFFYFFIFIKNFAKKKINK